MIPFPLQTGQLGLKARLPVNSAAQDLTTYTEVDTAARLSVTASRATWGSIVRTATAYLYKDFGLNHFSANVSIDFDFLISSSSGNGAFVETLGLSNQVGDAVSARTNALTASVYNNLGTLQLRIVEYDGGTTYVQTVNISTGTTYYCRLERDESVGTFGTAYLRIATSEANRNSGTWATTLTQTLHTSLKDFRYLYATASLNDAAGNFHITGYGEKYRINTP